MPRSPHSLLTSLQISSLLLLGSIFWQQILAPREDERLSPPGAVLYLFSACVACSILGILVTFSPVSVCPIYARPQTDRLGCCKLIQSAWGITPDKDQQIGGLLMWVPMCLVYLVAIIAQLARWFAHPVGSVVEHASGRSAMRKFYDGRDTQERAPRLGAVAARNAAASKLFPSRRGDGNDIHFLGINYFVGNPGRRYRSLRRVACRLDLRNSP